jgi:hypothetical protein
MLSFQLQKSPTPNFEEKCGNSSDISKGISQSGMCKFESSEVSHASAPKNSENPMSEFLMIGLHHGLTFSIWGYDSAHLSFNGASIPKLAPVHLIPAGGVFHCQRPNSLGWVS